MPPCPACPAPRRPPLPPNPTYFFICPYGVGRRYGMLRSMYFWAGTPAPGPTRHQHRPRQRLRRDGASLGLVKRNQINLQLDLVPFNQLQRRMCHGPGCVLPRGGEGWARGARKGALSNGLGWALGQQEGLHLRCQLVETPALPRPPVILDKNRGVSPAPKLVGKWPMKLQPPWNGCEERPPHCSPCTSCPHRGVGGQGAPHKEQPQGPKAQGWGSRCLLRRQSRAAKGKHWDVDQESGENKTQLSCFLGICWRNVI